MVNQNQKEKKKFIETLFGPDDRIYYCEIGKKSAGGKASVKNHKIITRAELLSIPWPVGASVGINPLRPDTARRSNDGVKNTKTILIDIDGKTLPEKNIINSLPIKPSFIFSRDENHHHLYFLLSGPGAETPRTKQSDKKYQDVIKSLIDALGGDKAVKDPARMVRLPFCQHPSGGEYKLTGGKIKRYDLSAVKVSDATPEETTAEKGPGDGKETERTPQKIIDTITQHYHTKQAIQQGGGRSLLLLHIGFDCHSWGLHPREALEIAEGLNEKLCDPPEKLDVLKHQIKSAYKYAKNQFGYLRQSLADTNDQGRRRIYKNFQDSQHVRETMADYVYIMQADRLIKMSSKLELTSKTQIENQVTHETGVKKNMLSMLQEKLFTVCEYLDFIPFISGQNGKTDQDMKIIEHPETGEKTYNRFEPFLNSIEGPYDKKAAEIFTEHLKFLTNTPEEYEAVLNFLAYQIQNPGKKLPYALLLISQKQGIGKSILEMLFKNIFKTKSGRDYVGSVENNTLQTGWTDYLQDRLICFVHELAQKDRYNTMNQLKNLITEPEVTINGKYARTYTIKNTTNLIMFSNKENAIHIDKQDRRLLVIYNSKDPQPAEYYRKLAECFENCAGDIYRYLFNVDLSKFNPHERPIMTSGKMQLIDQGRNELDLYLDNLVAEKRGPFSGTLFSPLDILQHVQIDRPELRPSIKSVRSFLIDVGGNPENNWSSVLIDTKRNGQRISRQIWGSREVIESRGKRDCVFDKYLDKYLSGVVSGGTGAADTEGAEGL